jgi:hypothetical protein
MRNHRRYVLLAPAIVLVVTFAAPTVEAGGGVSVHLGGGGFGVSVGYGDWGVYTRSWSDPYWSIDFNATLAGYGQWVWVNGLGRVWRPWVATSWQPYTYGQWVSTGCGLTWVAYEPWGYVPHHYGSWAYSSFGWVWVPGYSYSCANVVWVGSGGYVGWYARPPWGWSHAQHGFQHGYNHGYRDGFGDGYHSGYSDGLLDARYATYVDWRHFGAENVSRHAVPHRIASQSRVEVRAEAPSTGEIRQRGGASITETRLSRRTVTVDGREVTIARPEGVAPSIERNAADTVGRTLSEQALERRQPLVRPRTAGATSTASSSRPGEESRDARAPLVRPSTRGSTSSQTQRFERSARSSNDRSRDASSISMRSRSTTPGQRAAQQPPQTSEPQRSSNRAPQTATGSRQSESTQDRATESRRPQPRTERSASEREKKDSEEKSSDEPSPRRRR